MENNLETKSLREWKKVFESDLSYISYELKEIVKPPAVVFLEGPLGSGKTTFAKDFLGNNEETMSPSYSVIYEAGSNLHADFYRIKDSAEIFQLELPLYLDSKEYCLIEWGKKYFNTINREIPENYSFYLLEISVNSQAQRETEDKSAFSRNFELSEIKDI
jgi:tRNA threonylcarbamoyladenosine biosynthesis protein TsaE